MCGATFGTTPGMLTSIFCRERYFSKAGASKKQFEDAVDMGAGRLVASKSFGDLEFAGFCQCGIWLVRTQWSCPTSLFDDATARIRASRLQFDKHGSPQWVGFGFFNAIRCQGRGNSRRCLGFGILSCSAAGYPAAPGKTNDGHSDSADDDAVECRLRPGGDIQDMIQSFEGAETHNRMPTSIDSTLHRYPCIKSMRHRRYIRAELLELWPA